jgi:hypothetical protein
MAKEQSAKELLESMRALQEKTRSLMAAFDRTMAKLQKLEGIESKPKEKVPKSKSGQKGRPVRRS